ncbi:MAG: thiolase family protein [Myxococcota bacterium]|nr:thiolase family protein [Myxococcota bacterium]
MKEALIFGGFRSPIAKIRGQLSEMRADDLLAGVLRGAVERLGIPMESIGEIFAGCANQSGEDNRNVARMAALLAGFPHSVPGITVNRLCASGLDATIAGIRALQVGDRDGVLTGGVENMTRAPYVMSKGARAYANGNPQIFDTSLGWRFPNPKMEVLFPLEGMGETAENIATQTSISREDQDRFSLGSHRKAVAAIETGRFEGEIIPTEIVTRKGTFKFTTDEGPRAESSLEKLAALRPVFRKGGTVTAGNSSTLNDGAAALVLGTREWGQALGLQPMARVISSGSAGVDPRVMGLGPVPATQEALKKAGLAIHDLDLVELNEAFAVQSLAVIRELGLDEKKVNVNGGAIALGHPLGCSGARILVTLLHELRRQDLRYGLTTLCVGVGQGVSLIVENLNC